MPWSATQVLEGVSEDAQPLPRVDVKRQEGKTHRQVDTPEQFMETSRGRMNHSEVRRKRFQPWQLRSSRLLQAVTKRAQVLEQMAFIQRTTGFEQRNMHPDCSLLGKSGIK